MYLGHPCFHPSIFQGVVDTRQAAVPRVGPPGGLSSRSRARADEGGPGRSPPLSPRSPNASQTLLPPGRPGGKKQKATRDAKELSATWSAQAEAVAPELSGKPNSGIYLSSGTKTVELRPEDARVIYPNGTHDLLRDLEVNHHLIYSEYSTAHRGDRRLLLRVDRKIHPYRTHMGRPWRRSRPRCCPTTCA